MQALGPHPDSSVARSANRRSRLKSGWAPAARTTTRRSCLANSPGAGFRTGVFVCGATKAIAYNAQFPENGLAGEGSLENISGVAKWELQRRND
jgi:hypothetical protein